MFRRILRVLADLLLVALYLAVLAMYAAALWLMRAHGVKFE